MAAGGGIIFSSLQAAAKKRIKEKLASFALVVRVSILCTSVMRRTPLAMRFLG
jgi:hypothetical protein